MTGVQNQLFSEQHLSGSHQSIKVRQDILDAIEETEFKVNWGKTRIYNMIRDRGEWVISRQRVWGVPLPVFLCGKWRYYYD